MIEKYWKILMMITVAMLIGCEEQTSVEPQQLEFPAFGSDEYYENLREYKKTDHQLAFGWFGASGQSELSPSMNNRWVGLPDSLDLVSTWGGLPEIGSPGYEEMKYIQEVKGTRITYVIFSDDAMFSKFGGEGFREKYFDGGNKDSLKMGFDIVAKNLYELVEEYGLDGLDIDHEPFLCGCPNWVVTRSSSDFGLFLDALSVYFGKEADTGKLLIVDGEIYEVPEEQGRYIDYAIAQAYNTGAPSNLQDRYEQVKSWVKPKQFIVTENFESYWENGGVQFNDPIEGVIPSLLGMARWNPKEGAKGGAGAYQLQYDYQNDPEYHYIRKMIQIMNPAPKP